MASDLHEKSIKVYRAMFGRSIPPTLERGREGISDEELARNGIFSLNHYGESTHRIANEERAEFREMFPRLPVFISKKRALHVISFGKYKKDLPVLGEVEIPYSLLFGPEAKLKLVANDTSATKLFDVTEEIADKINTTEDKDNGEFRLEPAEGHKREEFVSTVRSLEHLFRPNKLTPEGKIDLEAGFFEIKLDPEVSEQSREISQI